MGGSQAECGARGNYAILGRKRQGGRGSTHVKNGRRCLLTPGGLVTEKPLLSRRCQADHHSGIWYNLFGRPTIMTAIAARGEVDAARTLRLAVPCDLPPGPVDVVVQVPANGDQIPPDIAAAVASLEQLTVDELERAARGRLADEASARLAELNDLRQRAGLSS